MPLISLYSVLHSTFDYELFAPSDRVICLISISGYIQRADISFPSLRVNESCLHLELEKVHSHHTSCVTPTFPAQGDLPEKTTYLSINHNPINKIECPSRECSQPFCKNIVSITKALDYEIFYERDILAHRSLFVAVDLKDIDAQRTIRASHPITVPRTKQTQKTIK